MESRRMESSMMDLSYIDMRYYSMVIKQLRDFFESKGWYEVYTQGRLSILAASKDPNAIFTYNYDGEVWPLPQSGQLWLEKELLLNPDVPGVFCLNTSYRNKSDLVNGREDKIFPLFEYEMRGEVNDLITLEEELLEYLGFGLKEFYLHREYTELTEAYGVKKLDYKHTEDLCNEDTPVVFLKNYPTKIVPYWNVKHNGETANKVGVILHGIETITSAERCIDKNEIRKQFYTIEDGRYANQLFSNFTKARVVKELDQFLEHDMIVRCGGSIGVTRMIRAMKMSNILYKIHAIPEPKIDILTKEEELLQYISKSTKSTKSRCWGIPVAARNRSASIASLVVTAASVGGEKIIDLAINSI